MPETDPSTLTQFPEADDWGGWIDVWCRDDTANIDCVPACLRHHVEKLVRPDGWLKHSDMVPNTPYKIARWFQIDSGGPRPPWIGEGIPPEVIKEAWEKHCAEMEAQVLQAGTDLYFIQSGECGPIKIGMTGMKIERRMKSLQTAHPFKLSLLALVRGAGMEEPEYHERFAEHRLEGEWFSPHPDILAEIDRLNATPRPIPHPVVG